MALKYKGGAAFIDPILWIDDFPELENNKYTHSFFSSSKPKLDFF